MAVTGYVFEISMENVKNRAHQFTLHGYKDSQQEAVTAADEYAFILGIDTPTTVTGDGVVVVYQLSGETKLYPDAQIIIRVKVVSVAEALNTILAQAKQKHTG